MGPSDAVGMVGAIIGALSTVAGAIGWYFSWRLNDMQEQFSARFEKIDLALNLVTTHLSVLNGRVGRLETWQEMHEHHDDERHKLLEQSTRDIWQSVNGLRTDIHRGASS